MTKSEQNYYYAGRSAGIDECVEIVNRMCKDEDGKRVLMDVVWLPATVLCAELEKLKEDVER